MEQSVKNREEIQTIKMELACGFITYDEAKKKAKPVLDRINAKGMEIAKKYGRKHYPITFVEVMR